MTCPNCGTDADRHLIPIHETDDEDGHPDYVACTHCMQLHRPDLLRDEDDEIPSQARLTQHERQWLSSRNMVGNQNNLKLSIIEWQCVKGAAQHYGVTDWKSKADARLSAEENISLMESYGSKNRETTLREMETDYEYWGESGV